MAVVTLLALGNGAPDSFASLTALHAGHARTSLAAILSAGTFVSAFVVGIVTIHASPFPIEPAAFVRDVFFYLLAASALFYVYLSGEIYLWQVVGLVGFYVFFVGFVFRMDSGGGKDGKGNEVEFGGEKRVSEAGGAYNSGRKHVSDTFVNSFWYVDQLGMAAKYDTKVYCRQTLVGGNYGLLDTTSFIPNPDYYSALLWHRLMGKTVLSVDISAPPSLRVYAHCAKQRVWEEYLLSSNELSEI